MPTSTTPEDSVHTPPLWGMVQGSLMREVFSRGLSTGFTPVPPLRATMGAMGAF